MVAVTLGSCAPWNLIVIKRYKKKNNTAYYIDTRNRSNRLCRYIFFQSLLKNPIGSLFMEEK